MKDGLPGTGLGGIFYLLCALLMVPWELVLTLQGKSSLQRWRLISTQVSIALSIIIMVTVVWVLIFHELPQMIAFDYHGLLKISMFLTIIALGGVMSLVHLIGAVVTVRQSKIFRVNSQDPLEK